MIASPVRTRFAPSPTGLPHIGNIRTALFSWLFARHYGGQFLLRLEDTDRERYDPAAEEALYSVLRWLGLEYDEGPDVGGPFGPYVQSQRLEHYQAAVAQLLAGGHAYKCFCSRERIEEIRTARRSANIHPYGYDRHCRALSDAERSRLESSGAPYVVRFAVPAEGETSFQDVVRGTVTYKNRELDDHVLLKSDGFPTYQLANVVDDHLMEVTHVIRAEEWIPSTPRHVLEYQALAWTPPVFAHGAVIQGPDRSKLSKRHGAVFAGEYQDKGYLPEAITNYIALLGWSPGGDREIMSRDEMVELFTLEGINPSPSVFDAEKLNWMNGVYIRALPPSELTNRALSFLQQAGLVPEAPDVETQEYAGRVLALEQERLKTLAEAPSATEFFFRDEPEYDEAAVNKRLRVAVGGPALAALIVQLQGMSAWDVPSLEGAVQAAADAAGLKRADVIHAARVAATGRAVGPGLFETLWVLGRERVLKRLRFAQATFCSG